MNILDIENRLDDITIKLEQVTNLVHIFKQFVWREQPDLSGEVSALNAEEYQKKKTEALIFCSQLDTYFTALESADGLIYGVKGEVEALAEECEKARKEGDSSLRKDTM